MSEINKIKQFLESADPDNAQFFFVKRGQAGSDYKYTILKANIEPNLAQELLNIGTGQAEKLSNEAEQREYPGPLSFDRLYVLTRKVRNVPYLESVLSKLAAVGSEPFVETVKNIRGYALRLQSVDTSLYLFKKYPQMKGVPRKKWVAFKKGKLILVDEAPLMIFMDYDAAILLQQSTLADETVCIFNVRKFESLFSFYQYYRNKLEQIGARLPVQSFLDDSQLFLKHCMKDPAKLRKMYTILEGGDLEKIR